ncbi:MAG: phosphotransferase [Candidatus Omnitrophica bacterium]|nr:phosphotransferase [Candidatus Omnitrophota bacterium]
MTTSSKLPELFAGVDAPSLDIRTFHVSRSDIEAICVFFSLGKLKNYTQEKGTVVSHSNFFVFAKTSRGEYALKFFPSDAAKEISIEYAINRFLVERGLPTPPMHCGRDRKAYMPCNGRLAACFSFINGKPAWQQIGRTATINKINATILSLKRALAAAPASIPRLKQKNLTATVRELARTSKGNNPYDQKTFIDHVLKEACRTYQDQRHLFTGQWQHNNTTLTNFLVKEKTIYTLDLSHIREDYALSDLASLVISCHFLKIPQTVTKSIVQDYFRQHAASSQLLPVLNVLINIGLIKEYLKAIHRDKRLPTVNCPDKLKKTYSFYLQDRKKTILRLLKKQAWA